MKLLLTAAASKRATWLVARYADEAPFSVGSVVITVSATDKYNAHL